MRAGATAANGGEGVFEREQLMEYVSFAKETLQPQLTDAAKEALVAGYLDMRRQGSRGGGGRKTITATTRQLESLVRLSEAHARMRLSDEVQPQDVAEAIRLMNVATQRAAVDPRTGTIDMSLIASGQSGDQAEAVLLLAEDIRDLLEDLAVTLGGFAGAGVGAGAGAGSARKAAKTLTLADLARRLDAAATSAGAPSTGLRPLQLVQEAVRLLAREDGALLELLPENRIRVHPRAGRGAARGVQADAVADDEEAY